MSKPKYWWYANVGRTIRAYPQLVGAKAQRQAGKLTASYSGMPRAGGVGRSTEGCALRQLSAREEADLWAVKQAIEELEQGDGGAEILQVVELYHWKGVGNFDTIGDLLYMSANTAKRRNAAFVYCVAKHMGYLQAG